jgi:hypothetical protein
MRTGPDAPTQQDVTEDYYQVLNTSISPPATNAAESQEANSSAEIVVSFCCFNFAFFSQHSRRNIVVTPNPIYRFSGGI